MSTTITSHLAPTDPRPPLLSRPGDLFLEPAYDDDYDPRDDTDEA